MKIKDICRTITDGSHNPPQGVGKSEYMMLSSKNIFDDEITFNEPRYLSQEEFFNKNVASENLSGYYLLQKGDFAYNKSYSGDYVWGTVKRLDNYEQGVLSPLYICFRPDPARVDSDFLIYYFESKKWHKTVVNIAGEGARNHGLLNISVVDYFNTIHCIPSMDEQKQIAQIIGTLLSKIAREQRMLNCYAAQRQYLLRQMFI